MKLMNGTFNRGAYYTSQYSWLLYIILPLLYTLIFQRKSQISLISSSSQPFNNSKNPLYFAHVTDVHINQVSGDSIVSFRRVSKILNWYHPEFILLTGDISDDFDFTTSPKYGNQDESHWKIYKQEIAALSNFTIIEISGNHDIFGVKSLSSSKHFFLDYSHTFHRNDTRTMSEYIVRSFEFEKFKIIGFHPYRFPCAHPAMHFFTTLPQDVIERVEQEILNSTKKIILSSHYPISMYHSKLTSNNFTLTDIVGSQRSVMVYLTGHTHPTSPTFLHHGTGGLEIIGPASFQRYKFGIVSLDNDVISWSTIDNRNAPNGIITYPTGVEQLAPDTIFNDLNADIRVIMFSLSDNLNIDFTITNYQTSQVVFSGQLRYSRILNNNKSTLYSFPLKETKISFGKYNITFSGDFVGSRLFVINNTYVVGGETLPIFPFTREVLFMTYPIFFLFLIFITYPADIWLADTIENWIETGDGDNYWYFAIFAGFILIRTRFQKNPKAIRIIFFCAVILAISAPLLIFETEDLIGFITAFGYYIDNKWLTCDHATFYSYFYLLIVCLPIILLCSSFGVIDYNYDNQKFDVYLIGIAILSDLILLYKFVVESVGYKWIKICPAFVVLPIFYLAVILIWRLCFPKRNEENDNTLLSNSISL